MVRCANCTYEIDEVNKDTSMCDTCQRAFNLGLECGAQWVTG